jgi:hypothetical protein
MNIRLLLPAALLAAAVGCDSILDTEPVDQVPLEQAISDAPTARAALIGAYDALQSLSYYGRNFLVLSDLTADNAEHQGTLQSLRQVDLLNVDAGNPTVTGVWGAIYSALARVNLIIAKVPSVPGLDADERDQILGEAHFLRALHFHNLVKYWGDVPMPLTPAATAEEAAAYTRTPVAQVYTQILADLALAETLMSEDQTRQASPGAAAALRTRVLLFMGNWQGVIDAAEVVEDMGYTLAPEYSDLFTPEGDDTDEDIFKVSFTAVEYNELGWYYLYGGRWEISPTADLFSAYEAGDDRFTWSVAYLADDEVYEGTKFPTTTGAEHLHVIRLGEVILNKAEALARLDRLALAVDEYNKLRVRAGLDPHVLGVDVTTMNDVLAAIWQERRVELAMEGDRLTDLVRTNRAATVLELTPDRLFQLLYPIPASERIVARGLTQNDGY